ncbi:MAG: DUF177 domain-containing protein [Lachnospiraceae bacterium]|nr:DUF177 domain-containing protein [Lachnospiraceae bacterium]
MLINLSEVMANVGQEKHTQADIEFSEFAMNGEVYAVASKSQVKVDVICVGEHKVSVQCEAEISLHVPCSRCLKDVIVPFTISFEKKLDFSDTPLAREELMEAVYIQERDLDVDALLKEELMIQFPMQVLCQENCKGICYICGTNLNTGSCDCDQQGRDPRMLAIQDIFNNR